MNEEKRDVRFPIPMGALDFEPAPEHYRTAPAMVAQLRGCSFPADQMRLGRLKGTNICAWLPPRMQEWGQRYSFGQFVVFPESYDVPLDAHGDAIRHLFPAYGTETHVDSEPYGLHLDCGDMDDNGNHQFTVRRPTDIQDLGLPPICFRTEADLAEWVLSGKGRTCLSRYNATLAAIRSLRECQPTVFDGLTDHLRMLAEGGQP